MHFAKTNYNFKFSCAVCLEFRMQKSEAFQTNERLQNFAFCVSQIISLAINLPYASKSAPGMAKLKQNKLRSNSKW